MDHLGGGKTLYAVRTAEHAMNKCVRCNHIHPIETMADNVVKHLKCIYQDKQGTVCGCENFKGIRVFANMYIRGAEFITPEQFMNIMTEQECNEFKDAMEFQEIPGNTIVEKFENTGFIVIRNDEVGLVVIDEVYQWVDARVSTSKLNMDIDSVILQSRKKGVDVVYTAQLPSSVDKRLKLNTELAVIAKKMKKKREVVGFKYVMATDTKVNIKVLKKEQAARYYPLYNTRQSVEKPLRVDQSKNYYVKLLMEMVRKRRAKEIKEMNQQQLDEDTIAQTMRGKLMELGLQIGDDMSAIGLEDIADSEDQ